MASGEITYKTLKQAKIAYAIAGWSIDLEEENLVIVSKQKNISHIIHAIVSVLTGFLWAPFWIALVEVFDLMILILYLQYIQHVC